MAKPLDTTDTAAEAVPSAANAADGEDTLDRLRVRIDEIDADLHRLLMERFAVVERIGAVKGPTASVLRPDREAAVIAKRLATHEGTMPAAALVHIWRVIMSAASFNQRPFTVHVAGARAAEAAQFLFVPVPMVGHASGADVVAALAAAPDDVAVVEAADETWAAHLGDAHVIARVPLNGGGAVVVLAAKNIARGTGPFRLVREGNATREVAPGATAHGEVLGHYHPFPLSIPVAR
ncbi:MAG: chorismate mutase [Pseudomonadota bacterium]